MIDELTVKTHVSSAKDWVQVFRPFSYTAAVIPVL